MDAQQQQEAPLCRFIRPPLPPPPSESMSDPPRHPPPPQVASWYPNQFQYQQPSQSQPPPHSTWPLPSSSYSTPHQPNSALPPYPQPHNPYLPSPPLPPQHMPPHPPPPSYSHPPQPYSQPNSHQTWGNPNWAHHRGWEHPDGINPNTNSHEEDWAARARAWAAAKDAMEGQHQHQHQHQHQQPHYTTFPARPDEQNHGYRDPYQHVTDPHYTDMQQSSVPAPKQQQFSVSLGHPHRPLENHLEESSSFTSGPSSSYASDEHAYSTRDGALPSDPSQLYHYQGVNETNSSVCQQEVPSNYSSAPGKEETRDQNTHFHSWSSLPSSSAQEGKYRMQPRLSDPGRGFPAEQHRYAYGNQSAESVADPSDRPLEFAPGFYHEYDSHSQHSQASYINTDPAGSVAPASIMTPPAVPGVAYPSMPSIPSSLQFDPSFVAPPIAGHAVPMFGQVPGPNFRPAMPATGASFGLGMGTTLHPAAAFDANGVSNISERPKKASVPNWLREEIKKSVITSTSQERPEEGPDNPIEEDVDEKSFARGGVAGSKNIDLFRSFDDEDDDEDDVEPARTTAINQEIKRVLTEVLLKVTDELFDEIASKVLSEEDFAVEADNSIAPQNHEILPSSTVPTPKASAKVLIPVKGKETEAYDASGKSNSGFHGDVLGLASYASDDEDELESAGNATTRQSHATHPQPSNMVSEGIPDVAENGGSQAESGGPSRANSDSNEKRTRLSRASTNPNGSHKGSSNNLSDEDLNHGNIRINEDIGRVVEAADTFSSKDDVGGKSLLKGESQKVNVAKSVTDGSQSKQSGRPEKHEVHDSKRRSADKDTIKAEAGKLKADEKHTGSSELKRDERHARKDKIHERNGSKDKVKDRSSRHGEKSRESDSRRSYSSKDDKIDAEKVRRASIKDDINRKSDRERDEKEDRSRHRTSRDSSKHKRRRSPSVSTRAKSTKDNLGGSHANESSDESSDGSRHRKLHSRKRSLSPSPSRSRRRQVSRSPHSKHSQRRHSPYSSLENKRGRRSRSKSPARRRK